ncbi:MbeB family mobilization protein [Enterobacter hormaechei]
MNSLLTLAKDLEQKSKRSSRLPARC